MVQRTQRPQRRRTDRRYFARRKVCAFCVDKITEIDYKEVVRLRRYLSEWAKIEPRRKTGTCAPHQRALTQALKRARYVALLPFAGSHSLMELGRPEGFRGDRGRPDRRERAPARVEQSAREGNSIPAPGDATTVQAGSEGATGPKPAESELSSAETDGKVLVPSGAVQTATQVDGEIGSVPSGLPQGEEPPAKSVEDGPTAQITEDQT